MLLLFSASSLHAQQYDLPATPPPSGDLCWDSQVDYTPEQTFEEFILDLDIDTGYYSAYEFITPLRQIGNHTFAAEFGELIEMNLRAYVPGDAPLYRVLVFIDEKPYVFEDTGLAYLELVSTGDSIVDIPLRFTPVEEGITTVVAFFLNTESEIFYSSLNISGSSIRVSIVVGDEFPTREYTLTPLVGSRVKGENAPPIHLNLDEGNLRANWSFPDFYYALPEGNSLAFRVLTGYGPPNIKPEGAPDPEIFKFALVVMADHQPVPVFDGSDVFYGQVTSDTGYSVIPVEISADDLKPGEQEIAVVKIAYPDTPTCVLNGLPDGYWLQESSYIARAGVEVTAP